MILPFDWVEVGPVIRAPNVVSVVVDVAVQTCLLLIVVHSDRCWRHACLVFQVSANLVLEVVHSYFLNPINRSSRLFPTFLPLLVAGLAAQGLVYLSLRIEWVEEAAVLLDLAVTNPVVAVVSQCSMRVGRGIHESHPQCRHQLRKISVGDGGYYICWLWR
jgi:hypothetical protein